MDELNDLPPVEKARALFELGDAARHEGRDLVAHGFYTQSLNLFRGHDERRGEADALVALADLALHYNPTDQNPHERRKLLAEEALGIYRGLGDKKGTARALRVLATVMPQPEALRCLEESLALATGENDEDGIAASLDRLGGLQAFRQPEEALARREEALRIYREAGNRAGEAQALFGLSISHMTRDPVKSRQLAEEALGVFRELDRKKQVAQMLMFLGGPDVDDETNIAYYTECREICHEIGVSIWEASCLRRLAEIAEKHGEHGRAKALREEADQIYPEEPVDPELQQAFEQALKEQDRDAALDAARKLFGGGGATGGDVMSDEGEG